MTQNQAPDVQQAQPDRRPGTDEGEFTLLNSLVDLSQPRGNGRLSATTVLDNDSAKIVAFEFEAGDELREHAAHHPVLIEVRRGAVEFTLQGQQLELHPGNVLHLTPLLRHAVKALEPATLTVTMLLPH